MKRQQSPDSHQKNGIAGGCFVPGCDAPALPYLATAATAAAVAFSTCSPYCAGIFYIWQEVWPVVREKTKCIFRPVSVQCVFFFFPFFFLFFRNIGNIASQMSCCHPHVYRRVAFQRTQMIRAAAGATRKEQKLSRYAGWNFLIVLISNR